MNKPRYPFRPKSRKSLQLGDFWAVPMENGQFACGRVLALPVYERGIGMRTMFVAGLMDWVGGQPPSPGDLEGSSVLEAGNAHIKMITETGGEVLGRWPLGPEDVSKAKQVIDGSWGFNFITRLAQHRLA